MRDLKEGQIYLLDGNVLVEATLNDQTGLWQLNEPEQRSTWLVSPNGKLLPMQFDIARDVWLLNREPDLWSTDDLNEADENTPKLPRLLRQVERIAEERYDGELSLFRLNTGWKAMYGSLDSGEEGQRQVQTLKIYGTLYEAIQALL